MSMLMVEAHQMGWVLRYGYLLDRGWSKIDAPEVGTLKSPHDGEIYSDEEGVVQEMLLEFQGKPTPRLGVCVDPRRGEYWEDGAIKHRS